MEERRLEFIKKEYITEYVAYDGAVFTCKEECEKYEESAEAVLYTKYKPLVMYRKSEYEIYNTGSDEYEIDIIKINDIEDIDILMQLYYIYNKYTSARSEERMQEIKTKLTTYFNNGDIIFIGRGCGCDKYDQFCFINSLKEVINHITEACNEENS